MILEYYFIVKMLHVVSATLVFTGSFVMAAFVMWSKKVSSGALYTSSIKLAFNISLFIVIPLSFFQMISGFAILGLKHYSMHLFWVWSTALAFVFFLMAQLSATYQLKRMKDGLGATLLGEKRWRQSLAVALIILLYMLFMMSNTPGSPPA